MKLFATALLAGAAAAAPFIKVVEPPRHNKILYPAVHWDNDFEKPENLIPRKEVKMYYSQYPGLQDSAVRHKWGDVETNFTTPVVMLEHTKYVTEITCSNPNSIDIHMDSVKSFQTAAMAWKEHQDNLMFVYYHDKCAHTKDRRTFWKVSSLTFVPTQDGGFAEATGRALTAKEAFGNYKINFGTHHPTYTMLRERNLHGVPAAVDQRPKWVRHVRRWNESIDLGDVTISLTPDGDTSSTPFGDGIELWSDGAIGLYCVGCGVTGDLDVGGSVSGGWLPPSLDDIEVHMNGQMSATMALAMVASAEYSNSFDKTLVSVSPPGFEIPEIINIGPILELKASLSMSMSASGGVLAGTTMTIGPFNAYFDMDGGGGASGFTPSVSNNFQAEGEVSCSAELGFPISLGFGVSVPLASFDKQIAIEDSPGITAQGTYSASTSGGDCNNGIDWGISVANDVSLNIFDVASKDISNWSDQLAGGCVQL